MCFICHGVAVDATNLEAVNLVYVWRIGRHCNIFAKQARRSSISVNIQKRKVTFHQHLLI